MSVLAHWDSRYPDPGELRREVEAMTRACIDALVANIPRDEIEALYLLGSAIKDWDTPVDYVPEFSDIDIHVLFADNDAVHPRLDEVSQGLRIQKCMDEGYRKAIALPLHVPRVQLRVTNELRQQPDYTQPPPTTVRVLLGRPPSAPVADAATLRARARQELLDTSPFLTTLGRHIADMAGKHLWVLVHSLTWRIAPTGPRVLELLGAPHADAWSLNRSAIVKRLEEMKERELARDYAAFYLNAWEGFMSDCRTDEAARRAVWAGAQVLSRGTAIAQEEFPLG
jgi:hypothetical protein